MQHTLQGIVGQTRLSYPALKRRIALCSVHHIEGLAMARGHATALLSSLRRRHPSIVQEIFRGYL
jgi:hypothetical protein